MSKSIFQVETMFAVVRYKKLDDGTEIRSVVDSFEDEKMAEKEAEELNNEA